MPQTERVVGMTMRDDDGRGRDIFDPAEPIGTAVDHDARPAAAD
jgi:hypothetical protein